MRPVLALVVLLALAGCLEPPRPGAPDARIPSVTLPSPAPQNASEWRPSFCGGGTHGSAKPSCLVLTFHDPPPGLRWEDVVANLSSGEPVAHDRGQEQGGAVNPSPPSRASATAASWCAPESYEDEAWCSRAPDPSGPVGKDATVLVWWTSDAAVAGQRVTFSGTAAHEPFASSSPLA